MNSNLKLFARLHLLFKIWNFKIKYTILMIQLYHMTKENVMLYRSRYLKDFPDFFSYVLHLKEQHSFCSNIKFCQQWNHQATSTPSPIIKYSMIQYLIFSEISLSKSSFNIYPLLKLRYRFLAVRKPASFESSHQTNV